MRKIILLCATFFTTALSMSASPVQAQNVLWVGPNGSDGNACSQTSPCATFQGAINKGSVAEINCLGSGNYGQFTVTASITVDCGAGNVGNVAFTSGNAAITVNASSANVILRHLSVNGEPMGNAVSNGINASGLASGTLIVENCMVQGITIGVAIVVAPNSGRVLLQVSNSQMFNNLTGISVQPSSGQIASVTLNNVELVGNGTGMTFGAAGIVAGTMRKSVVGANSEGLIAAAGQVFFTVEESSIVDNTAHGIHTFSAGAVVNVGNSTIGGNGTGVFAEHGSIISFGNNQMSANASNGAFTGTTPLR